MISLFRQISTIKNCNILSRGEKMNLFDTILMNSILVIFPYILYFLYLIYVKTVDQKKNELLLDFAMITSFYFILKFNHSNLIVTYVFLNIPLLIAYYYHRKISILCLSIFSIFYYQNIFNCSYLLLLLEYLCYYILYLETKSKKYFSSSFIILKCVILSIYLNMFSHLNITNFFLSIVILGILIQFILFLFERMNQIIELYLSIRQIKNDQKLYESLFKITHEIKNPIAVIKGYLDMFDIHNEKHSIKYIPIIKGEVNRVLILLEDFLSIKRLNLQKEIIDINYVIEEVTQNFEPLLKKKKIRVILEDGECYIVGDYNRLKQVFINLMKNSVEAISSNGLIKIKTTPQKNQIKIEFSDNGIGMSEEEILKLNYPFFTTKQNGTGLGVYLSREIIEKHNGSMKSESNHGVRVTIKLPYDPSLN